MITSTIKTNLILKEIGVTRYSLRPEPNQLVDKEVNFRVLETSDEYFDYYRKRHGLWKMYGLNLPDEVLKKLYYKNALKLFPSIDKKLFE